MIEDPDDEKPEGWLDDAEEWVPDEDAEQVGCLLLLVVVVVAC